MMQVAVIGTGYVGLVAGTCFAELGWSVTCVDKDGAKVAALHRGEIPIHEPGLDDLVRTNVASGRLKFTTDMATAAGPADAVFLAVGTPSKDEDGDADLSQLFAAIDEIIPLLSGHTVLVTKSTVPIGTGRILQKRVSALGSDLDVDIVSNPEFLREGAAISDFLNPDRVVIGAETERARAVMRVLYRPIAERGAPVLYTNIETAEMIKYAANSFLATKISFINEMADLAELVGADIVDVSRGMGMDNRIGKLFLNPGPGYGGSCFPKDTRALRNLALRAGKRLMVTEAAIDANNERKQAVAARILDMLGGQVVGATVAVLGVAFKANTDDVRESPSLDIINRLQQAGARVQAYDPEAMAQAGLLLKGVIWAKDAYSAIKGADVAVIATEWDEFKNMDLQRAKMLLRQPQIVDLRNLYDPAEMAAAGIDYVSVGRGWIPRWSEQFEVAE